MFAETLLPSVDHPWLKKKDKFVERRVSILLGGQLQCVQWLHNLLRARMHYRVLFMDHTCKWNAMQLVSLFRAHWSCIEPRYIYNAHFVTHFRGEKSPPQKWEKSSAQFFFQRQCSRGCLNGAVVFHTPVPTGRRNSE